MVATVEAAIGGEVEGHPDQLTGAGRGGRHRTIVLAIAIPTTRAGELAIAGGKPQLGQARIPTRPDGGSAQKLEIDGEVSHESSAMVKRGAGEKDTTNPGPKRPNHDGVALVDEHDCYIPVMRHGKDFSVTIRRKLLQAYLLTRQLCNQREPLHAKYS